ncbi:MAG: signal peptidase I, partial [Longimicrobiales bacterium]
MEEISGTVQPLPEPAPAAKPSWTAAVFWLRDLFVSVLFAVILIVFIYQPVKVEGTSMMPSLTDQERIFINKFTYRFGIGHIERGDMVVFWFPMDRSKSY